MFGQRACPYRKLRFGLVALAWIGFASAAHAEDTKPKLGPRAIPLGQSHQYLRAHPAPDYWALAPYYAPQMTNSACSLAAISMLVNALRGLPGKSTDKLVTQPALLDAVASDTWKAETAERGSGITWGELERYTLASLAAHGLDGEIEVFKPTHNSPVALAQVRRLLVANERSDRDIVLVYFNQGVVTGDWDGPHISPIGSYDAARRRVLIMDVDRQWYVPYWTSDQTLLEAMLRPAPAEHGVLAGETGGLIRVTLRTRTPTQ